jgi:hypothetical protein
MIIDFSEVGDVENYASVPEGTYLVKVVEVRDTLSKEGHTRWGFRLEVLEGPFAGRTAAWDWITWSEKGLRRAKHVLDGLGFEVRGKLEVSHEDLIGRSAKVLVGVEEREDLEKSGRSVLRNRVPFQGYERAPSSPEPTPF